jgi:hypothetical protein
MDVGWKAKGWKDRPTIGWLSQSAWPSAFIYLPRYLPSICDDPVIFLLWYLHACIISSRMTSCATIARPLRWFFCLGQVGEQSANASGWRCTTRSRWRKGLDHSGSFRSLITVAILSSHSFHPTPSPW